MRSSVAFLYNGGMEILLVREPLDEPTLKQLADAWHGMLVKGVADLERKVIALGGDWHMDANTVLISDGSAQHHVWGFNIYPDQRSDEALEYNRSLIFAPGNAIGTWSCKTRRCANNCALSSLAWCHI
jgi:hypothetical protein